MKLSGSSAWNFLMYLIKIMRSLDKSLKKTKNENVTCKSSFSTKILSLQFYFCPFKCIKCPWRIGLLPLRRLNFCFWVVKRVYLKNFSFWRYKENKIYKNLIRYLLKLLMKIKVLRGPVTLSSTKNLRNLSWTSSWIRRIEEKWMVRKNFEWKSLDSLINS